MLYTILFFYRTKSNQSRRLSSIGFGNRTYSNSQKSSSSIMFDFRTNRTPIKRLGSIVFWFGFVRLATPGLYVVCFVFSFVLFSNPPRSFFRLNHARKAWNRCSHSRFSSDAIILGFFDRNVNVGLCCCGRLWLFISLSQAMTRGEKKNVINSGFLPFR